ncbi:PREDICTED: oxysterol-binding protein-related protein 8 [Propithecus coquereli]|uniref:oxysterol-binding protein-related protein 8 n=1 Tax=Propithecus coquereli TaxID=379532 RepID=UPI00063F8CDA|nr:PREDICTED: oxysterol-binding protein-related protein 8 [Propithecus coquereli]
METGLADGEPDRTSLLGDSKDVLWPSTVVANSDEAQLLTPGKMSQRQGKEAYPTPTKDLHQPSLSPASPHSQGFERGKEDISQNKDESSLSMSKSKSESKLYNGSEKDSSTSSKLTKKESLKIRGTLKSWTKLWCVLKPGVLLIYKTQKNGQWVGTVLLNACEIIERPSKKDGFCFKLFHPLEQSIWAVKCMFLKEKNGMFKGRCWMDALELALKCSSLLKRTMIREGKEHDLSISSDSTHVTLYGLLRANNLHSGDNFQLNDSEIERQHFKDQDMYSDKSDKENDQEHDESDNEVMGKSEESDTDTSERQDDSYIEPEPVEPLKETTYTEQSHEELGEAGEASQTETVSEENKSLIWTLLKQVRPGMDLSRVVLPTFILEPRSFLDKLSDYYYHADFLSEAALEENPYFRLKKVVKWYLSGFYKKPKGLKKPYNPILGETFRCLWIHPRTNSKTFYIAEQDSEVFITDKKTDNSEVFWNPTPDIKQWRLIRHTVKFEEQGDFESEKLWQRVTRAINAKDQTEATQEKYVLEEAQRQTARDRKTKNEEWTCKLFELDPLTGEWHYKFADTRPWDPLNDMIQFEKDGVIQTKVKHRTPMVSVPKMKHKPTRQQKKVAKGYSSPEPDIQDSSGSEAQSVKPSTRRKKGIELGDIQSSIESIKQTQEEIKRNIMALRNHLVSSTPATDYFLQQKDYFLIFLLILLQVIINFMFK